MTIFSYRFCLYLVGSITLVKLTKPDAAYLSTVAFVQEASIIRLGGSGESAKRGKRFQK